MSIEDRIRQATDALESEISSALAGKVRSLADELASVAVQERVAAEAEAMARLAADVAAVREEAERGRQASVTEARAEAERVLGIDLQRARAEAEALRAQTVQLKEEADRIGAEASRLKEDAKRREQEVAQLKDGNDRLRDEFDRLKHEFDQFRTQTDQLREEIGRAHQASQNLRGERDAIKEERDRLKVEAANAVDVRATEREATIAGLERLANTFRRLDGAGSLSDVLGALAEAAAAETARAALLVSSQSAGDAEPRFKLWSIFGFPTAPDGFELTVRSADDLAKTGLPFAPLDASRAGLALPIQVGGRTVAMLYADDGEAAHTAPAGWPEAIELLARHSATRLETIIALRSAQALGFRAEAPAEDDSSARRYAKLLISEIKMYNEAPVRLGRQHRDLYKRLRAEIERARRLFEERVPPSGGRQAFDDELVQTLAGGDPSLLGIAQAGQS